MSAMATPTKGGVGEAGDRAVHDARVFLLRSLVAQARLLEGAPARVFDEHVRACRQLLYLLETLGIFEVHAGGPLVAVYREEVGGLASGEGRSPVAGVVPALGGFDLEDARPEVREHHRRVGVGEGYRERSRTLTPSRGSGTTLTDPPLSGAEGGALLLLPKLGVAYACRRPIQFTERHVANFAYG